MPAWSTDICAHPDAHTQHGKGRRGFHALLLSCQTPGYAGHQVTLLAGSRQPHLRVRAEDAEGVRVVEMPDFLPTCLRHGGLSPIDIGATANMLCDRSTLETIGGFEESSMLGDTLMSWSFAELGIPIWFDPHAIVEHHHFGTWRSLLRERYDRGREFAHLRHRTEAWSRKRTFLQVLLSVAPLRLRRLVLRGVSNAFRSSMLRDFLRTSPVVISGQAAWLAGEMAAYLYQLRGTRQSA